LTLIDMKFFRRTERYTLLEHKRNEEILEELKVEPVDEKLRRYKSELVTKCDKNEQRQDEDGNAEG
jgi:hypothetical protein